MALDSVLAIAARMAFRLKHNTFVEASLMVAGLELSKCQFLQHFAHYLMQKHRAELEELPSSHNHCNHVNWELHGSKGQLGMGHC